MKVSRKKDYFFVGIQLILFGLYAIDSSRLGFDRPNPLAYLGLLLSVAGLCTGVLALLQMKMSFSPFPSPTATGELVTTGMFAFARHPIYFSILLAAFGFALYTGSGWRLLISFGLVALFYLKSSYEEDLLSARYPDYAAYRKKVRRFGFL